MPASLSIHGDFEARRIYSEARHRHAMHQHRQTTEFETTLIGGRASGGSLHKKPDPIGLGAADSPSTLLCVPSLTEHIKRYRGMVLGFGETNDALIAASTRSAVRGSSLMRTPTALAIAFAIAAGTGPLAASPMDLIW